MTAKKNRITVNLNDREYEKMTDLSIKHRVSLAWLGRQAIIEMLERHQELASKSILALGSGSNLLGKGHNRKNAKTKSKENA